MFSDHSIILRKCTSWWRCCKIAFNNVFERILSMQLCDYFQDKLSPYLSAYRKHYSCQTALLRLLEQLRTVLDSKEHAAMVGIDLSKAFDCLPHELLLSKLKAYHLSENSVKFLASYLRANVRNFRESVDSHEFLNFFIFRPNNLYSTLISKITLKLVTAFYFFRNQAKFDKL